MTGRIFTVALIAGLAAGLAVAVLQHFTTTPIILHAEEYESKAPAHGGHAALFDQKKGGYAARGLDQYGFTGARLILAHASHDETPGAAGDEGWAPKDGLERTLYTALADLITGVGFALVLTALIALRGRAVDGRSGLLWGVAGFFAVSLLPALGLPPEVPGSIAAELSARQAWWIFAAASAAGGIGLMILGRGRWAPVAGMALMILPHAMGAPQPDHLGGAVPPELAGHFVAASLVTAAAFWAFLGWLVGVLGRRYALISPA